MVIVDATAEALHAVHQTIADRQPGNRRCRARVNAEHAARVVAADGQDVGAQALDNDITLNG